MVKISKNDGNNVNKLYLVEGIPGSGKTTTAKKLYEDLKKHGKNARLYTEGELNPADMAWHAYLTEKEYSEFLESCKAIWEETEKTVSFEQLTELIEKNVSREDGMILLAYTKIEFPDWRYWEAAGKLSSKEIGDGRRSLDEFKSIHLKRWKSFAESVKDTDQITIFECAFLQNHIFELMGVYEMGDEEIMDYLRELIDTVRCLNPKIIYLRPASIATIIGRAAAERKSDNPEQRDWIDEMSEWVSNTNYGKSHSLTHKGGVIAFCRKRLQLDLMALDRLGAEYTIIERE